MSKECENCIKRKTMWCPTSIECMALDELPSHLDKTSALQKIDNLQQENKQLKEDKKKAREFIEKNFIRYKDSENDLVLNELVLINIEEIKELLEILGEKE